MIDPVITSPWGLAVLKWLKELPETIKAWGPFRHRHLAVSIVPQQNPIYHEAAQADGTIVTQIVLECLITNGLEDCSLRIGRAECHVRLCGTVRGIPCLEKVPPGCSAEGRFFFYFLRALNQPRGCTLVLFDQFGNKHKKWIRLQHGKPHDPF